MLYGRKANMSSPFKDRAGARRCTSKRCGRHRVPPSQMKVTAGSRFVGILAANTFTPNSTTGLSRRNFFDHPQSVGFSVKELRLRLITPSGASLQP
ncbi:hypothetical protein GJAV_G00000670 [Gymnothorax javanicus]|nr:hypothetical protein GJAV_G00000670 [Gymnothorax javanicus]